MQRRARRRALCYSYVLSWVNGNNCQRLQVAIYYRICTLLVWNFIRSIIFFLQWARMFVKTRKLRVRFCSAERLHVWSVRVTAHNHTVCKEKMGVNNIDWLGHQVQQGSYSIGVLIECRCFSIFLRQNSLIFSIWDESQAWHQDIWYCLFSLTMYSLYTDLWNI